ncbi:DMT family transporter [Desertibaculum subflavum]|uniref:DMT family transporter n=1 Tax=Desertibaculum subflavum TaxID=2268458 RepID=UPI000E664A9C
MSAAVEQAGRGSRLSAYALLTFAVLLWAGNWIVGRAVHESFPPAALNFWRWTAAVLILVPFALPGMFARRALLVRHWRYLALLGLSGITLFQTGVYVGLRSTPAVNAVLLNASFPLSMVLVSWAMTGERASMRQVGGMLVSALGVIVIMSGGEIDNLRRLEFHVGDLWILAALPFWAVYSVLLKRRPPEFGGVELVFLTGVAALVTLLPLYAVETALLPPPVWSGTTLAAIAYIAVGPSVLAFVCWNRGVALVGPNIAGLFVHLMPAFGTLLAVLFLGERFLLSHGIGIAVILAGVMLVTATKR